MQKEREGMCGFDDAIFCAAIYVLLPRGRGREFALRWRVRWAVSDLFIEYRWFFAGCHAVSNTVIYGCFFNVIKIMNLLISYI